MARANLPLRALALAACVGAAAAVEQEQRSSGPRRSLLFDTRAVPNLLVDLFNAFARFFYAEALGALTQGIQLTL